MQIMPFTLLVNQASLLHLATLAILSCSKDVYSTCIGNVCSTTKHVKDLHMTPRILLMLSAVAYHEARVNCQQSTTHICDGVGDEEWANLLVPLLNKILHT